MSALEWRYVIHAARLYGYEGPATPKLEADVVALAAALAAAARAVDSPPPNPGTGPRAYIARVVAGDVSVPLGGVG